MANKDLDEQRYIPASVDLERVATAEGPRGELNLYKAWKSPLSSADLLRMQRGMSSGGYCHGLEE